MGHAEQPTEGWIPEPEYEQIRARVPIVCVDLLPLASGAVGLIRRSTYGGEEGWCLVGGAMRRNEPLREAIARHLRSSLGDGVECELASTRPLLVAEYFTDPLLGDLYDPRKHAVALTYAAACHGEPKARGEALEFRWFDPAELNELAFGFGQGTVVEDLLGKIDLAHPP